MDEKCKLSFKTNIVQKKKHHVYELFTCNPLTKQKNKIEIQYTGIYSYYIKPILKIS